MSPAGHDMKKQFQNVTEALQPAPAFRCPCCRFKTPCGRAQEEICKVCYWQDDGQDDHDADDVRGGPNGTLSLRQARLNFGTCGASDQEFVSKVRRPSPDES